MLTHYQKSMRLPEYDYNRPGHYFVTFCTKNRINNFGEVKNGIVLLSELGEIAKSYWEQIPKYYPNVAIDTFVIMPNHIHGIITILEYVTNSTETVDQRNYGQLSKIIKSFKNAFTSHIRDTKNSINTTNFSWQKSFYDHIIRDERYLNNIRQYIINNPHKWHIDFENPQYLPELSDKNKSEQTRKHYTELFVIKKT